MTGQVPKYGKNFRLESLPWTPDLANRAYVLKADPAWFIRSDKTSGKWQVYHGTVRDTAAVTGTPLPTLTLAMTRLLDGIAQGFYQVTSQEQETRS